MKPRRHRFRAPAIFGTPLHYGVPVFIGFGFFISGLTVDAGDILRGGSSAARPTPAAGSAAAADTPDATDAARANARDTLARTNQTLDAMRAMQNAARNAALANSTNHLTQGANKPVLPAVPNGLGTGGLQPTADPTKWTGADTPLQTLKDGLTQVTIKQTTQQALLGWQTFNVGKETTVTFDQTAGGENAAQWIAFNKISDPSGNPTQILGSIKAAGQVYLINQNGIIFGGSSQVNAHALTASALPINDNLVERGLLNNPDQQFLFSSLAQSAGNDGTPAFDPALPPNTKIGDVTVEAGAKLTAPSSAAKVGGRISLIGANVTNNGTIETPDGQTILAAGLQVGFDAHSTSDPSLRGLDTYVGSIVDPNSILDPYAGTATNNGLITAPRASVTIAGKNVRQMGVVDSSTSVSLNGRIDLLANYDAIGNIAYQAAKSNGPAFLNRSTGTVELGEGSVTRILPEIASTEKAIGTTLALPSQVNLSGKVIHFDNNAVLLAPNANVTANAGVWLTKASVNINTAPIYQFVREGGRIDLDDGAVLDVSGSKNVVSSATSNIVEVQLRGSELADSPLQRDGVLRGETIYVDITKTGTYNGKTWVGTPLADVSGYANLIQRTVGELTAAGGTVTLNAGEAVVVRDGAIVDVSGGSIDYQGAVVKTSRVFSGRNVIDISEATPDRVYDGVLNGTATVSHDKWGVSETFQQALAPSGTRYQESYTQGGGGGTLKVSAGAMVLDGELAGHTFTGPRQREIGPHASLLDLSFTSETILSGKVSIITPVPPTITFSNSHQSGGIADFSTDSSGVPVSLPADRISDVILSQDLVGETGFGSLSLYNPDGDIIVPETVKLETVPQGSISFSSANISIEGSIITPGGSLVFNTYNLSPSVPASSTELPSPNVGRGHFSLGSKATLSTAGWIVDDRPGSAAGLGKSNAILGGAVSIRTFSADLASGSLIDVSGGVNVSGGGKVSYGNAGSISILTGKDLTVQSVTGGDFLLGSTLKGMSGAKGGSLTLGALSVRIGGGAPQDGSLFLESSFFSEGGFSSYSISGVGRQNAGASSPDAGLVIKSGTVIAPVVESWLVQGLGSDDEISLTSIVKPEGLRNAASLSFTASGLRSDIGGLLLVRGDLVVEQGARIDAGAAGTITLKGDTVAVEGSLTARGGGIQITGGSKLPLLGTATAAASTVWLSSTARLDASGITVLTPDAFGRRRGAVLDGGSISVSGNIIADAGATLDVSGTSGILDLQAGESGKSLADLQNGASGTITTPYAISGASMVVESDGGKIKLSGGEMLLTDASLVGRAGGKTASGGTLQLSSGRFYQDGVFSNPFDPTLVITGSGTVISTGFQSGIAREMQTDASGVSGGGRFSADDFTRGGFANLDLAGTLQFSGPVSIDATGRITAGTGPAIHADGAVHLNASYIAAGVTFQNPVKPGVVGYQPTDGNGQAVTRAPSYGGGTFSASAGLIDVGYLSFQGIGSADLTAAGGDIRGNGTLEIAGDVRMNAGQIYPTTAADFTIAAFNYQKNGSAHDGSVTVSVSGTRSLPLSAGGTLSIYAAQIIQNGVLRAPFGHINLGWDGSGAAPKGLLSGLTFAATKGLTLGANSITSVSAIDPLTGKGIIIPYGVSLDGNTWLDPRGVDITSGGVPQKAVKLSAGSVTTEDGSVIDIRGGGDLFAYRWVEGQGGSKDVLANSGSFAILPGYTTDFAPYAPFNAGAVGGDAGYANNALQTGQQVELAGGNGLPAGIYTLLPARYALLPGAFLVTPLAGSAVGTVPKADGSTIVSGSRFNGLESGLDPSPVVTRFEIASGKVIEARAEYTKLFANTFLKTTGGLRLPGDAGQLVLGATQGMAIGGQVLSAGAAKFRAGIIDVSSPVDIFITGPGSSAAPAGTLSLDASLLSSFGAESLLIGGIRTTTSEGTKIDVTTTNLTIDNHGSPLMGSEIILVAGKRLEISEDAILSRTGSGTSASGDLLIGDANVAGSGNGALVRIGSDENVSVTRSGFTPNTSGSLIVGANASLQGDSLILDSTAVTQVAPSSVLAASSLSLSSGRVSLVLDPDVVPGADAGLVLSGATLSSLSTAGNLALSSYSSLDLLGSGKVGGLNGSGRPNIDSLTLRAAEVRGLGNNGGNVEFIARTIHLDNQPGGTAATTSLAQSGSLSFQAENILLGSGAVSVRGFSTTRLDASGSLQTTGDGAFKAAGDLYIESPLVYSTQPATYRIEAVGDLTASGDGSSRGNIASAGLGSSLSLIGASVSANTRFVLPSGQVSVHALSGNLSVGGSIETNGVGRKFKDVTRYTDGGMITLAATHGSVLLASGASLDVSAPSGGGDAGTIQFSAPEGSINLLGELKGTGGEGGKSGGIGFDIGSLASLSAIDHFLDASGFNEERDYRIRNGNVEMNGVAHAHSYSLAADKGSIILTGKIDASGKTGGSVSLIANQNLTLADGSSIDVSGDTFDAAGKGGSVVLETRGNNSGVIQMNGNSTVDLRVDAATSASAAAGKFTGTLHLRAPRVGTDLAIGTIDSKILGASNIIVEGFKVYDLTATTGTITTALKNSIKSEAANFIGSEADIEARENRLLASQGGAAGAIGSLLTVRPGAEIAHTTGSLTLGGATTSGSSGDWNLADFRFGAQQVPGVLTLRAAGDLVFFNSLSDGFDTAAYNSALLARNANLPNNAQGWSFRLVSGADFSSADTMKVKALDDLGSSAGSLLLGKNGFAGVVTGGNNALTSTPLSNTSNTGLFQVIRTGSGDIDIAAGRDIRLLNQFATIYTAGTLVQDPTLGGQFDTPTPSITNNNTSGSLGAVQQPVPAPVQYTSGGGNVTLSAGNDIIHLTKNAQGLLIADSERQIPNNWLYRRGFVDPVTGEFGISKFGETASTTWWVDYTNFFEGIGALGGGNVSLSAGRDVSNVDAVVPTNVRMPKGLPNPSALIELGGGDVTVKAARNIDGGVYYVERGHGELSAGGEITTNSTRSPSLTILSSPSKVLNSSLWLPTTLFLGKGTFDVTATGNLLLGPTVNSFLLPAGYNNTFWYKSYFSTYSADSGVNISSLGGDVTLRQSIAYEPGTTTTASTSVLQRWFASELLLNNTSASFLQPWLRLSESSVTPFATAFSTLPSTIKATAISGNLRLQGDFNLSPSSNGTLEMLAAGSINGFNLAGFGSNSSSSFSLWSDTRINLSDANPLKIPGISNPFAYQSVSGVNTVLSRATQSGFMGAFDKLFAETGSSNGVLQEKQSLHSSGLLHAGDDSPALLYAENGDIDGLTFFSAKSSKIIAGQDIRDVSFYLQNTSANDISLVSAGRDLIAFDSSTASQVASKATGNLVALGDGPAAGDIQIAGPGTLEVFAGRELDLGIGGNNADGTGTGITSIGNGRNPYLPFKGADIIAAAGIGETWSLDSSAANFPAFIEKFVTAADGAAHLKELGMDLSEFSALDSESQRRIALQIFYFVLRDAGRDHNNPDSPGYGNYDAGKEAVATLFPEKTGETAWNGDINTRARDIRTKNGGEITLFAPGGGVSLATSAVGNPLAPPGIITESGGNINIFTDQDVDLGISRIFTLRGGDEIIWSSHGDIAAGSSSKTVQSAPPTRVLIDPQSADVRTDLAGLATGGGIGVLATVAGVEPSNVDLIAPLGTIDAGDAGIRVSGNLNIAAAIVVNAGNISVGGASSGTPAQAVSTPSMGSVSTSSNAASEATDAVTQAAAKQANNPPPAQDALSLITVEVIGYGGGGGEEEDEEDKKDNVESGA